MRRNGLSGRASGRRVGFDFSGARPSALAAGGRSFPAARTRRTVPHPEVKPGPPPAEKALERTAPTERDGSPVSLPRAQARAERRPAPTASAPVLSTVESLMLEERTRWAMTIHDGLTQSVTSAILELQVLRHRIETDPAGAADAIAEIEAAIRGDLSEIREVLFQLGEGRLRHDPSFAAFVRELVERWKLPARVTIEGDPDDVPRSVLETAYSVIGEALANAAKHSGSKDVSVKVVAGATELRLEVTDRGRGIAAVTDDDPHFGLRLLRTRVQEIDGSIDVESTPGRGVRVIAVLPVGGQGEDR